MDWVKLATRYYLDPKIVGLDADAEVLFIRGLAYAGDQETRGFIPDAIVPSLARSRRPAATVRKLVDADLWKHAPGGYRMPAWGHWQDQLDVLAARRAADRDRKRRERAGRTPLSADNRRGQLADTVREMSAANSDKNTPLTSNVRGQSRDVRALEGEGELEQPKGGMSTHDPPTPGPPPRRCSIHATIDGPVPPCGACADARRTQTAWLAERTNGTGTGTGTNSHPLAGQQAAALATAERHQRAARGDACKLCNDTGWTLDDNGQAIQCTHQETT